MDGLLLMAAAAQSCSGRSHVDYTLASSHWGMARGTEGRRLNIYFLTPQPLPIELRLLLEVFSRFWSWRKLSREKRHRQLGKKFSAFRGTIYSSYRWTIWVKEIRSKISAWPATWSFQVTCNYEINTMQTGKFMQKSDWTIKEKFFAIYRFSKN